MRLFGTDGIRGEVGKYPLTAENALKLAKASSLVLRKKNSISRVVINKDTRLSGYIFEPALASGFISMGIDVILVGPLPTPALTVLGKSLRADFSVMITASHNPYKDNGLKFFSGQGLKISHEDENKIEDLFFNYDFDNFKIKPSNYGKAIRLKNALGRYSEALKQSADRNLNYSKLKVILDCANGASYKVAPEVLFELGLDLHTIGNNPSGININQNCGSLFPLKASDLVKKKKCDIGICLDGDGDRVVIIDEKGKVLNGEELIYILAKYYLSENKIKKGSIVVTNEIANYGLDNSLKKLGLKLKRVKVGDKNILKQIIDHKYFFGGEPSGHFIFRDDILIGDGMTTAIRLLTLILKKNKKLSELRKGIDLFEVININQRIDREKFYLSQESIYQKLNKLCKNFDIYYNIRPSGTEPLLRVNLQYEKRNIKVSILKKLKTQIIKVISDAC
ncbi:phosphoglucosamine mutase [Alphaproteobacteria bacterium]|jgi:phosphoglucosamine mutase|nr:phosphoglucosamine mutase [Alphaproteobacteria bacterium]